MDPSDRKKPCGKPTWPGSEWEGAQQGGLGQERKESVSTSIRPRKRKRREESGIGYGAMHASTVKVNREDVK